MPPELFTRSTRNPILHAEMWPYAANVAFNPAAARVGDETIVLVRIEEMSGLSHLSVARSRDGETNWSIDPTPLMAARPDMPSEGWGFEDARVVWVEEKQAFAITCTCYGPGDDTMPSGPAVYLAFTKDFRSVEHHGILMPPDDKNSALLPERVNGDWILFHRPTVAGNLDFARGGVALSRSPDLATWSRPEAVMQPRDGAWWDSWKIGIGPPPIKTDQGWLLIYHGVKHNIAGAVYRVGLAMTALDDPARLTHRAPQWVLGPKESYERIGDVDNVVFPCGVVIDEATRKLSLYYGAADTVIGLATAELDELIATVLAHPVTA